jgi:menaquinone-dependent protoporphyrinogen IX oxidase
MGADLVAADAAPDLSSYDVVVLGSPIYAGDYLPTMTEFVQENKPVLEETKVAAFITAAADVELDPGLTGDEDELLYTQQDYADGLANMAGGQRLSARGFGGRMDPDQLDERDRKMLGWFYRHLMRGELQGFDLLDLDEARRWGEELRDMIPD